MKSDFYPRIYFWLVAHRRWVLLAAFLIACVSFAISSRIRLEEDILGILPQRDSVVGEYKYTLRKFRQIDRAYIDVGTTNKDSEMLARAADQIYSELATNNSFAHITYQMQLGDQRTIVNFLTGALPNLFSVADESALGKKIQPNSVRNFLTEKRRQLAGPEGMVLKNVVAADPIGMSAIVLSKIAPLQTGFGDAHVQDGRLVSADGKHILIIAEPKFTSSDSARNAVLVGEMLRVAHNVENNFPGTHVAITGGHRMALDNATLIRRDAMRCMAIALTAMFILCFTAYRRRWLAIVTFLPSLFGTLFAGAVVAIFDHHISAIAIGFASMAIGITVDYGIYVVYHLDNAATDRRTAARIIERLILPTFIGASTIVAAFIVLAHSPMQGYQQLGLFGAAGVVASAAFALFVLPLLIPLPKQKNNLPQLRFTNWMEKFHAWQKKYRPLLLLGVLILTVVAIIGLKNLRFEGDVSKLNGITEPTKIDDEIIRTNWGDALSLTLVVARGKNLNDALAQNDRAADLLAQQTNVTGIFSLASICPAPKTQIENIQRWQKFWTPQRKENLRRTLQTVSGELGFRTNAFSEFWKTVEEKPALISLNQFRGTALEEALNERVAVATNDVAISTLIKLADRSKVDSLRAALPNLIVIDQKNFADHIAALAKNEMLYFALWTAIAVGLIVYFALTSIELVMATLLPLGFGLLWTLGFMGLLGLPINVMNCVFVIFVIGIGEDYSVFLATSKLDEWRGHPPRIHATSASVLISAATTIFGFAVLIFARHPVLFSMGTTVLLGMISAFIATIVITPLFMDLLLFRPPPIGAPRWWHPLLTIYVALHLGLSQIFLYYILRPLLKIFSRKTADEKLRRFTSWMARGLAKVLIFGKLEWRNITRETFSPPCIVISNHQSAVDVMLVVCLPGDVRQTPKKRVFDEPFLGVGCKILGHVMVEPNNPQLTLQRCREKISEGACVHFYPEGTRSPDGFVRRFHRGAFELAVQMNQEILPLILCDTNTAVPRDAYWFEPYHAVVNALPRVTPQNFDYSRGSLALKQHCEKIIRDGLQMQLDELNTPRIVRRKVERLYRYQGKFVEQFAHWKMKTDPVFNLLDAVAPREGFILDLGCGYGLATNWLAQFTDARSFLGVDYDENKIRVAQRSAPKNPRRQFEQRDILEFDYPASDAILLLDVLHYWTPQKQQLILEKAKRALRPGGKLILRDAACDETGHRRVSFWEKIATFTGQNQTREGLHFQTTEALSEAVKHAGFSEIEIIPSAGRGSNILLTATVSSNL